METWSTARAEMEMEKLNPFHSSERKLLNPRQSCKLIEVRQIRETRGPTFTLEIRGNNSNQE
jgi:hypothetical protein